MKAFHLSDVQFKSPSNFILAGPSGSGKTTLLLKLLSRAKEMFLPAPADILYAYGQFSSAVPQIEKMGIKTHEGVPTEEDLTTFQRPLLLVLDDLLSNVTEDYLNNMFTKISHHDSLNILFVTQSIHDKKLRVAKSNSHYIMLMRAPSAQLAIRNLGTQLFPSNLKFFMESYKKATKENFGYLLIDLHPTSPVDLRLRTNIFPPEQVTVFLPQTIDL